ncbi:MAG: VacJ family lipoprotein [Ramlibacter sp.]|nr:VacJ family lipoprotein [Ramlibacter sp.]MCW5649993.1 VacJ family lipoprotein [Ramlibacter sp.]
MKTSFSRAAAGFRPRARVFGAAVLLGVSLLASGCASGPRATARDPLEPLNRKVAQFNDGADAAVLKPLATAYREVTPAMVRTGVSNFFGNLRDLWSSVNSALQFKGQNAAENFMRFNVNTFFGLGGILDVASELNIDRHREDFGQTLGRWGVPAGPYVVLPLLGPSTLRDTFALSLDSRADPVSRIDPTSSRYAVYTLRAVDVRSNLLRASSVLDGAALDKYTFVRDVYLQRRRAEISEGRGQEPDDERYDDKQ